MLLVMLGACDGASDDPPDSARTGPQPLPRPTSRDYVTAEPVTEDGRYRFTSVSAEVKIGVPYAFTLFTACGLDYFVDFGGSLWAAVDPAGGFRKGPPEGFDDPRDRGTMTLVDRELATYVSSVGERVRFVPRSNTKLVKPCGRL